MLEARWLAAFVDVLGRCGVKAGDACAVLAETQSRPVLVQLASLALQQLGAHSFVVTVPSPAAHDAATHSLARCALVVDCTVEGLQHAAELPAILAGGARVLVVSNEHPEILERCLPRAEDEAVVRDAMRRLKSAKRMTVYSRAGTDLQIDLAGARVGGVWGFTSKPGTLTHWPGGLASMARWCSTVATSISPSSATSPTRCACRSKTTM
jgi:2,5-dihydroxypyridine 5,6-dioxygenase